MKTISKPKQKTYYIAHNNVDVFHHGEIEDPNELVTGQPELETFIDVNDWLDRLNELGVELEED